MVSSTGRRRCRHSPARQSTSMSYLRVLQHLQHAAVGQQRAQRGHRLVERDLRRRRRGRGQHVALGAAGRHVAQRDVAGAAGRGGEADADQVGPQRVQAVGLGVERDHAGRRRPRRSSACSASSVVTQSRRGRRARCPAARPCAAAGAAAAWAAPALLRARGRIAGRLAQAHAGDDAAEALLAAGIASARRGSGRAAPPAPRSRRVSGASSSSVDQALRDARLLGILLSASRRFGCLILATRPAAPSRSPYSVISCAAVLMPMPGTPGTLSVGSPASAWTSDHLVRGDAELLQHLGRADRLLLDRVEHLHAGRGPAASGPCRRRRW